jgi:CBS domain-containing protein
MRKAVFVCREEDSVASCAQLMRDQGIGFVPVVDARGQVSGLVTDRDLSLRVLAEKRDAATPVSAVMTRDVRVCHPEDDLLAAEAKMARTQKSRLVVVDGEGRCVGVISLSDVAQSESRAQAGNVLYAVTRREAAGRKPLVTV